MSNSNDIAATIREDVGDDVEIHDTSGPQAVFITTRSKIHLALIEYKRGIQSQRAWVNPALLMITILPIILVADFSQTLGFSQGFWLSLFTIAFLLSTVWLAYTIFDAYQNRGKANIEYVMEELESEGQ